MLAERDVSLKDKNTYNIGGKAAYYSEPADENEIREVITDAQSNQRPVFILGKGSNLLVSDQGWPGIVINLSSYYNQIFWEGALTIVQSGAMLNTFVNQALHNSFSGVEELSGIPGTIGGGVIMNAGAFTMCISDHLEWVQYYDYENGIVETRSKEEMGFGYRESYLKKRAAVVLKAAFKFTEQDAADNLIAKRNAILSKRKEKQPLEYPNCGSVFKRPIGNYAGTLIESSGLKGLRIGGAEVSQKHANFIVNTANCTAEDVRKLIYTVQKRVYEASGVLLEPEVMFLGDFEQQLFMPS